MTLPSAPLVSRPARSCSRRGWHRGHRDLGDRSGSARRADRPRRRARGDGEEPAESLPRGSPSAASRRPAGSPPLWQGRRTGDRTGRARCDGRVHRCRPPGTDRRAADVERPRPPAGRAGRRPGEDGTRELDAQPTTAAQTAAALMVGIALVSAIAVLGASLSRSARTNLESAVTATTSSPAQLRVAPRSPPPSPGSGGVDGHQRVQGQFELRGSLSSLAAVDPAGLRRTVHLAITAGSGARPSGWPAPD